jgi:serine/threonine-protein kinase HipA
MGILTSQRLGGKEVFSFEYESNWFKTQETVFLDPNLMWFGGNQYLNDDKPKFGLFLDSSADRWGRMLMNRREALLSKKELRPKETLYESDYLLGVFDAHRMGGLRFKESINGEFLNNQVSMASPPWIKLRELEYASLQIEKDVSNNDSEYLNWINMLMLPGSSLGGARPKAGVVDTDDKLWIAKFPSVNDDKDIGAWEMVAHILARECGIILPNAQIMKLSGKQHTFLSQRFDRGVRGSRIHFASAMTVLGHNDGHNETDGASYLELVEFILQHGENPTIDLEQLWRRIVFSILISNTDDHLHNHGFLLSDRGWQLSPAYDINPNEFGTGLSLNVNESSNALDLGLAIEVAKYFKLNTSKANNIAQDMINKIKNWSSIAKNLGISRNEISRMESVFRLF